MEHRNNTQSFPAEPRISDFMTPVPATVDAELKLVDALDRMYNDNIRHLPVLNDRQRLIGVLSSRDIAIAADGDQQNLSEKTVFDAMSNDPYTCTPDTPLAEVIRVMESRRLGSAVVLEGPRVAGMFTTIDALRALRSALEGIIVEPIVVPRHRPEVRVEGREQTLLRRGERNLQRGNRLQASMRWALFSY